jgi:hypothetical protein
MEKLLVAVADNKPEAVVVEHVKPEPGKEGCIMLDEYRKATVL